MPRSKNIKKVLVIGSGPIVIGQAAEFDYAGTQACRVLREDGCNVVLVNSNPATIMTDKDIADHVYIEPLTKEVLMKIIEKELPDSILGTLGGQTGLNLATELAECGFLDKMGVKLLGASPETIRRAEDRQEFKDAMLKINQPLVASTVVKNTDDALKFAEEIGLPVIVRPAFTLGGTGGGIAYTEKQLKEICDNGLKLSRVNEALIEKCISGWKEIEFEAIRDAAGNAITVCSMENVDPVGVHTGDSIVVAPAMTLGKAEFSMLRSASLAIISELGIEGGCNIQFALHPDSMEYAVIEVNPRVSRSSALASKATGYPIARVSTKIALGYRLDEIVNAATGKTFACFEPTVDYCVVKFPKWPFDKFVYADRTLGTQMMATGEVMSLDVSLEGAMMKAIRGAELGVSMPFLKKLSALSDGEVRDRLSRCDDERIFTICEALYRGVDSAYINSVTKIDVFFINKLKNIVDMRRELEGAGSVSEELYKRAKAIGFTDKSISELSGSGVSFSLPPVYKTVDTCSGEFDSETSYYYSVPGGENESRPDTDRKKVLVFGSGPIRIGQGIEFDYCSVHCVWAFQKAGYEAIIMNNNPETVSTDFDTADKLYFEPLTEEDVIKLYNFEKPDGVVVQFGGQTAIKLAKYLKKAGATFYGTSPDMIDAAEDRELFDELLERLGIPRPKGHTVFTEKEALNAAEDLGYPVLMRPSYVLGGQNMIIAYNDDDIREYMEIILRVKQENPILIDKYLGGKEVEVDAICDGENILIPGIMEHIERAGIHSGDSISVYPSRTLSSRIKRTIADYTERLAKALNVIGLVNIQYVVYNNEVYVIEVNPRSSRTVPYISKVTGIPMVNLAVKCMLGEKLTSFEYGTGLYPEGDYYAVKVPVFSFAKLHDVDTLLGPEMKSTGEALGIANTFEEALHKGLTAAGLSVSGAGGVLISVRDSDKLEVIPIAERLLELGFTIYATAGTARTLNSHMVAANYVRTISEPEPNIMNLLNDGKINLIISTSKKGRIPQKDGVRIRRKAVERSIPCLTSLDTAAALVKTCLRNGKQVSDYDMVDIAKL